MIPGYRLVYADNPYALPQLWEWEQPYIDHLILNARTFNRTVEQRYFRTPHTLFAANRRLWNRYHRPNPLCAYLPSWTAWINEYRTLVTEVQDIYEEACKKP